MKYNAEIDDLKQNAIFALVYASYALRFIVQSTECTKYQTENFVSTWLFENRQKAYSGCERR
jgi:hypothetical protein